MERRTKSNLYRLLDHASGYLPYLGFVLIAVLVVQAQTASQISEKTLKGSVARQESLRNILWSNLVLQRVEVLALKSRLKKDPEMLESANGALGSIPSFFSNQDSEENGYQKLILDETSELHDFLGKSDILPAEHADALLAKIEDLGSKLNERESKEWFKLNEQNEQLLEDFKKRHHMTTATYAVFAFYLLFLGWVTSRKKQAELYLKQSEKKARMLADASFEGLAIISDNVIIEVNPAFEKLFEVEGTGVIGKRIESFFVGAEINLATDLEFIANRAKSGPTPVEVAIRESRVEDVKTTIIAIRDLSDKKQSENLKLEKEAAEKANKAKSVFLANMSHELRTPMHGILSFARFGLRDAKDGKFESLKGYFDEVFESGSRLMQLLNDLLDLAKLESGKMEYRFAAADFSMICDQVISEMSAFAQEKQLKLVAKIPADQDPICVMDSARISQVLCNIVSNAIKFSLPNTEIAVEVNCAEGFLTCAVLNMGLGIPASELETIFDKFVQSSKTRTGAGGTGLGLSICREIVLHHKGKIWAESQSNGLTRFLFTLPVGAAPASIAV